LVTMYLQVTVCILTQIFFEFLKQLVAYFRVSSDNPAILVVDDNDSHSRDTEMLQRSVDHGLCLICLPPQTTHWLQPTKVFLQTFEGVLL
jgi:hypothetical protein